MVRFSEQANYTQPTSAEDDLGRLIRWSLEDFKVEPPARAWPKILERVREIKAPMKPRRRLRRALVPVASLVQAVVISALLLALGLGVDRNLSMPQSNYQIHPTPTVQKVSVPQGVLEDMLRGYKLARMELEPPAYKRGVCP